MREFLTPTTFRNAVFGVEDSLVSTVGLLSGIAIAGVERETIFLTGVVLLLVEGLSMAAGSFLSESSAQEFAAHGDVAVSTSYGAAAAMFVGYFAAGFIPLMPYLFLEGPTALAVSVGGSLAALFVLGLVSGALSGTHLVRRGLRMLGIGGLAIVVGMLAGRLLSVPML